MPSRRRFLRSGLLAGAGTWLTTTWRPAAGAPRRAARRVFADLHFHATLNSWMRRSPALVAAPGLDWTARSTLNPTGARWQDCHRAGIDLVCAVHYDPLDELAPSPTDPTEQATVHAHAMMDLLEEELGGEEGRWATYVRDRTALREALDVDRDSPRYRVAVVHALEGAHALGGRLEPLEDFARRGVAYITLTHFVDKGIASTGNALPFFPDAGAASPTRGLSGFGLEVLREMERVGILVDATHASTSAMSGILGAARQPLLMSHVSARALGDHPYSLPDEHLQEIARRGGLLGVILYPFVLSNFASREVAQRRGSLDDVVRTVQHLVKVCGGHRSIAFGSDFSGYIVGPRGLRNLRAIGRLAERLHQALDDPQMVEDILANNAIGFLSRSWGAPP